MNQNLIKMSFCYKANSKSYQNIFTLNYFEIIQKDYTKVVRVYKKIMIKILRLISSSVSSFLEVMLFK